eukprot:COSAG05_NODE_732_length_7656_cov_6.636628_3_plen_730_part_00
MAQHGSAPLAGAHGGAAALEHHQDIYGGVMLPPTPVIKPIGRRLQGEGRDNHNSVESDVFGSVSSPASSSTGFNFEFGKEPLFHELPPRLRWPSSFEQLPDELVLRHVLSKLDSSTLARCARVSTQMWRWSDNDRLWKVLCQQRWGAEFVHRCISGSSADSAASVPWKVHFVDRTRKHRSAVADSGLSLARLSLEDNKKAPVDSIIKRPVRSQLEAACVYMPRSNEDASTMAMAQSKFAADSAEWSANPATSQTKPSSVKKSRRGRRGRNTKAAGASADPVAAAKASHASHTDADTSPVLRHRTSTQPADTTLVGRVAPSPPNGPIGRRSPPFGRRPTGGETDSYARADPWGHPIKSAGSVTQRQKQPTPPPAAHNPRRRELNLRVVNGTDGSPPPAPRTTRPARSFSPSSLYSGCVTPTRMFNVHGDSSSDEDENDGGFGGGDDNNGIEGGDNYSALCHPVYESVMGTNDISSGHNQMAATGNASSAHGLNAAGHTTAAGSFGEGGNGGGSISVASPPCPWHSEALDQYCLQCRTLVCNRCCLFGHHSGHPRVAASEAYTRCKNEMLGSKDKLEQLVHKVSSCESRIDAERKRVAKERSAMKKSLRHGIKGLRDLLNQKQNELMEMLRVEEETKLAHVAQVGQQLSGLRKELADGVKAADAIKMVSEDCPLLIESSNALEDRTKAVAGVLDKLDKDIAVLPQLAAFQFTLNDQAVRENIESLSLAKME